VAQETPCSTGCLAHARPSPFCFELLMPAGGFQLAGLEQALGISQIEEDQMKKRQALAKGFGFYGKHISFGIPDMPTAGILYRTGVSA